MGNNNVNLHIGLDGVPQVTGGLAQVSGSVSNASGRIASSFADIGYAVKAAMAAFAAFELSKYVQEAATLAARVETLSVVMKTVGSNSGYSATQMEGFAEGLKKVGITTQEAYANITKMTQAGLDLTQSSKLARVAQDAAVIGNINSSEAFARMIHGIRSGEVEVLRNIGLSINQEQAYKKFADVNNLVAKDLSETQKVQARANAVMAEGTKIVGTYEASMTTAGKMLNSMARLIEELKLAVGNVFLAGFTDKVNLMTDSLKWANKHIEDLITTAKIAAGILGGVLAGVAIGNLVTALTVAREASIAASIATQAATFAMAGYGAVSTTAAVAVTGVATATTLANRAMSLMGGPLGVTIALITAAAGAWYMYISAKEKALGKNDQSESNRVAKENEEIREKIKMMQQGVSGADVDHMLASQKLLNGLKAEELSLIKRINTNDYEGGDIYGSKAAIDNKRLVELQRELVLLPALNKEHEKLLETQRKEQERINKTPINNSKELEKAAKAKKDAYAQEASGIYQMWQRDAANAEKLEEEHLQALAASREYYNKDQIQAAEETERQMIAVMEDSKKYYSESLKADAALSRLAIENKLAEVDAQEKFYQLTAGEAAVKRIDLLQESLALENASYLAIKGNSSIEELERAKILKVIVATNSALLEKKRILADQGAMGGAISALEEYSRAAQDISAQTKNLVTDMLQGMEDALVQLFQTGKIDGRAMIDSLILDIERMAAKQIVMNVVTGASSAMGLGANLAETANTTAITTLTAAVTANTAALGASSAGGGVGAVAGGAGGGGAAAAGGISMGAFAGIVVGIIAMYYGIKREFFTDGGQWNKRPESSKWQIGTSTAWSGGPEASGTLNVIDYLSKGGLWGTGWNKKGGGLSLGISNGEISGQEYVDSQKKKSMWRGSEYRTDFSAVDAQKQEYLTTQYAAVKDSIRIKSAALGISISTAALEGFNSATTKINLSGMDTEAQQKAVNEYFRKISNEAILLLVPDIEQLTRIGEDATAAYERMNQLKLTNNGLLMREMELLGTDGSAGYLALLNTQRAAELLGMEASTQAIQKRIWSLEDERASLKAVTDYADYMEQKRLKTLATTANSLQDIANIIKTKLIDQISLQLSALQTLTGIKTGELSVDSPEAKYKALQAQYAAASDKNKVGLSTQLLASSQGYNASGAGYQSDYAMVTADLARIGDLPNIADLTLTQIQTQTDYLSRIQTDISMTAFDQKTSLASLLGNSDTLNTYMTEWFRAQTDATNANKLATDAAAAREATRLAAEETALRDRAQAGQTAMMNSTMRGKAAGIVDYLASPASVGPAGYKQEYDIGDMTRDNKLDWADFDYWNKIASGVWNWSDMQANFLGVLPAFASGSPYIPNDMTANIHQGEMIFDRQSADVLRKYGVPTTGSADNKETVAELKEQNRLLRELLLEAKANVRVNQAVGTRLIEQGDESNQNGKVKSSNIQLANAA